MDLATVFAPLSGRQFEYKNLRAEIEKILSASDELFPAEIYLRDILATASANGWIVPEGGVLRVALPKSAVPAPASAKAAATA